MLVPNHLISNRWIASVVTKHQIQHINLVPSQCLQSWLFVGRISGIRHWGLLSQSGTCADGWWGTILYSRGGTTCAGGQLDAILYSVGTDYLLRVKGRCDLQSTSCRRSSQASLAAPQLDEAAVSRSTCAPAPPVNRVKVSIAAASAVSSSQ
jgi:hypothetical protein